MDCFNFLSQIKGLNMKKSLLIWLLLLSGCSFIHFSNSEKEKNPQCASFEKEINIISVYDDLLLGSICKERTKKNVCTDVQAIRLPREKNVLYYDGLTIQVPEGKCMAFVDVYSYITRNRYHRSIPIVNFVDKK